LVHGIHGSFLQGRNSFGSDTRATLTTCDGSLKNLLMFLAQQLLVLFNHASHTFLFLNIADVTRQVLETRGKDEQKYDNSLEAGAMTSVQVSRSAPAGNTVLEEEVVTFTFGVISQDGDDAGQAGIFLLSLGSLVLVGAIIAIPIKKRRRK